MKRFVIFANGNPDPGATTHITPQDTVICADGGTHRAVELGITPHIIIGDLDSVDPAIVDDLSAQGTVVFRYPVKKNKTDLELALDYVIQNNGTHIVLLTACGGRIDQMLGNLLVFTHTNYNHLDITIVEGNQKIFYLNAPAQRVFTGQKDNLFSILPLSPELAVQNLTGTEWPLKNELLHMGECRGLSNKFVQSRISLSIDRGACLVIVTNMNDKDC